MPSARPRRPRHLLRKLLFSLTVFLVALEIALRVFDLYLPMARIWRWHPTLGWTQVCSAGFDFIIEGDPVHNEFNSMGFRDVEHRLEKPPGTRRIVVVGDSFCEAVQVNLAQTFYRLLEASLTARGPGRYEAINLGVGDWGQAQELIALRDLGMAYAPDLVVCSIFPLNDICNNGIDLYGLGLSHNDFYRPYFVERDGALELTWHDPWRQRLRRLSRVFLNIERAAQSLSWSLEPGSERDRWQARSTAAGFEGLSPLCHSYVPDAQQPPAIKQGWSITERLLTEMVAICRQRGVAFVAVVMAWENTVSDVWPGFAARQPPPAMEADYPERRLAALFARLDVPVILTKAVFEANLAEYRPCRGGHLGPGGHRLVAGALLQVIDQLRLLR